VEAALPLRGIRVADFGWRAVAPISARMLAWGGAEVVRIESTTRHDGARLIPPLTPGVEGSYNVSGWFNNYNSNKLSVSLNLRHPAGRDLALKLVSISDIVVENFAGGVMDRLGLGYEELRRAKPDIIMASHSLTGLSGPWRHVRGHGPMAASMAGMHALSGYPDREPIAPGQAYTDYVVNPHHSAYALLAALHFRRRTGRGQYIDLAQYESIVQTTGTMVLEYTTLGRSHERSGNRSPYAAPQGVYPCLPEERNGTPEERWCAVSVEGDEEWCALCRVIERPELGDERRYATAAARADHADEIDAIISAWTAKRRAEDVMLRLQEAGVAAGVVQDSEDLLTRDPQLAARGHYRRVVHAEAGETRYDGPPFTLSACPIELRPAPLLGEHNDYVFKELLGLSDAEISAGYTANFIA
jgi:benzylsuccinate CoA-transferase BbsF subunit